MRTYERVNPWLTFELDLRLLPYPLWLLLGEAQSLCEMVGGTPLHPETAQRLHRLYRARGVLATAAISGNTLAEREALALLDEELMLPESQEYLGRELHNIADACDEIEAAIRIRGTRSLTPKTLQDFNAAAIASLPSSERLKAGVFRHRGSLSGRYEGAPAEDCEFLVTRLCQWLNAEFVAPDRYGIAFGVLKAIAAHVYLAWIQPFDDGNGRVARLAEFQTLISAGVPAMSAHLFAVHYHQTRSEFERHLEPVAEGEDSLIRFAHYAIRGFVDALREQMATIREEQVRVHWDDFVRLRFEGISTAAARRKHLLVVDLSTGRHAVPAPQLRHISPRVAEAYAGKSAKTLSRDVAALEEMGLVERVDEGIRARIELMRAYVPAVGPPRSPSGRLLPYKTYDAEPDRTSASSF